jgi:hypothetical protein
MKKIIPLFILWILIIGGFGAVSGTECVKENVGVEKIYFSQPNIVDRGEHITIDLAEATTYTWETGKPMLPVVTKVYTFPFGTQVDDVKVTFSEYIEKETPKPIRPAPESYVVSIYATSKIKKPETEISYADIESYPEQLFSYRIGAGLKGEEHVIYLSIYLSPVQYHPNKNTIYCSGSATIDVTYTPPENPVNFPDEYDLLILASEEFSTVYL